jgi:diguanylate cyclase (GGDEF)-like protein
MSATARASDNLSTGRDRGRVLLITDARATPGCGAALERAGFSVVGVAGGAAAMVALRRTRPHLVVADTSVRGITAGELAHSLAESHAGVPLVVVGGEEPTRAVRLAALSAGAFDYFQLPAEIELLLARAAQLVRLTQAAERLRAEAERDDLTGLANRRSFRRALGREVERWRRYRTPCALLLVDIDHMKLINDAHGHSAGDTAIRHVAAQLAEHSRDNDTAARLGGEEFALLLAGADDARAAAAAERLRVDICDQVLPVVGTVSVSVGVASCPAHAESERALYTAGDAALFRAKRGGRNRTAVAQPQAPEK